jgi:hypothetical protein
MRVVRLNESQLRAIIAEEMTQALEQPVSGRGPTGVMKVKEHLNQAKQAVSEMLQSTRSPRATEQAQALVAGINRIISAIDRMGDLTRADAA